MREQLDYGGTKLKPRSQIMRQYRVGDQVLDGITGAISTVLEISTVVEPFLNPDELQYKYQCVRLDNSVPTSPNFPDRWRHDEEITPAKDQVNA